MNIEKMCDVLEKMRDELMNEYEESGRILDEWYSNNSILKGAELFEYRKLQDMHDALSEAIDNIDDARLNLQHYLEIEESEYE